MRITYVYIFSVAVSIISSCDSNNKADSSEQKSAPVLVNITTDSLSHTNDTAAIDSAFDHYYADNTEVTNIQRPSKNVIETDIDTAVLFDIWTTDPNGPHADFVWNADYFDVADYDGDSRMPYKIDGRKVMIFFNDGIRYGELVSLTSDTLKIHWREMEETTFYVRWRS